MKTITKLIYAVFAAVVLTVGAVTANGAESDLFASINGTGMNGGGSIYQYTPIGVQSIFASSLSRPRGVAFDSASNLFVATTDSISGNFSGAILKIAPDGTQTTFANVIGPSVSFFLSGLTINTSGNVFIMAQDDTDANLASTIYEFTPGGVQSTFGSVPGQGFGLAFDSAGNLYAADGVDVTIYKFTPDGTRSVFIGPSAFTPGTGPIGVAFDRFGNLFVSTEPGTPMGTDTILKFTPNGVESTFAMGLDYPRGLAFDVRGNLFVADLGRFAPPGAILRFTPSGMENCFCSCARWSAQCSRVPRGPAAAASPHSAT
jgi:hypothetical protein